MLKGSSASYTAMATHNMMWADNKFSKKAHLSTSKIERNNDKVTFYYSSRSYHDTNAKKGFIN